MDKLSINSYKKIDVIKFTYRNFRKSSKSKIVNGAEFSFLTDGECIIKHISSLQQLQMCLGNLNFC